MKEFLGLNTDTYSYFIGLCIIGFALLIGTFLRKMLLKASKSVQFEKQVLMQTVLTSFAKSVTLILVCIALVIAFPYFISENESNKILKGLAIIIGSYFLGRIARKVFLSFSELNNVKENVLLKALLISLAKSVTLFVISLGVILSFPYLIVGNVWAEVTVILKEVLLTLSLGILVFNLVEIPSAWFESLAEKNDMVSGKMFSPILKRTLQVIVVCLIMAQIFQAISDKQISPIIAGLGIGGAAIALASQDTFKHFFGSFVLAGDKPFEIGERVVIDGHDGPIESIGMRSTKIRTLEGHQVTVPNGELANKTIKNIGRRPHIRRLATISITYDTPPNKIEEALSILKELLKNHEGMDEAYPPRVYFKELSAYSLDIMMIYWYHPASYWDFMDFSNNLNLNIVKRFNEAGIEFAFPTQTVHVQNQSTRQNISDDIS